jgi:hypothetical protein
MDGTSEHAHTSERSASTISVDARLVWNGDATGGGSARRSGHPVVRLRSANSGSSSGISTTTPGFLKHRRAELWPKGYKHSWTTTASLAPTESTRSSASSSQRSASTARAFGLSWPSANGGDKDSARSRSGRHRSFSERSIKGHRADFLVQRVAGHPWPSRILR